MDGGRETRSYCQVGALAQLLWQDTGRTISRGRGLAPSFSPAFAGAGSARLGKAHRGGLVKQAGPPASALLPPGNTHAIPSS